MNSLKLHRSQSGVALILSLLFLFILTLVAVASFSSSHVQERAASNARLQTLAFEAAAAGASNAVQFFMENVEADAPDTLCGKKGHLGWGDSNPTEWREVTYDVDGIRLFQSMYCLNDEYPCGAGEVGCEAGARPPRSQLFVLSRGDVESNGSVVATREVEVRIDRRNNVYVVEGCGAICFPACGVQTDEDGDPLIDFPASNAFTVDGGGGAAVTAGSCDDDSSLYDAINDDIKDQRIGNYDGDIHKQNAGEPWNNPDLTEAYREAVAGTASIDGAHHLYIPGDLDTTPPGTWFEDTGVYVDDGNTVYGTPDDPMIVYVEGDLEFGGGISGAGIIMVEGNIAWNGTPDYKGLIVTLGGTYTIDGGGTGGDHAGSVVVLNHQSGCTSPCPDFGGISWENTGGGTAEYTWNCDALMTAFELVDDNDGIAAGEDENPWGFDCERGPPTLFETPGDLVITSWRENIGWREDYFATE